MSKISQHGNCRGSSVWHCSSGVRRRPAEDQGRVQETDRHEVGFGDQGVREEVKSNAASSHHRVCGTFGETSMKRFVGLSLAAGVVFACMAATSGQAAPLSGAGAKVAPTAQSSGVVSQVYWRHRHCAWRHHHRHCW